MPEPDLPDTEEPKPRQPDGPETTPGPAQQDQPDHGEQPLAQDASDPQPAEGRAPAAQDPANEGPANEGPANEGPSGDDSTTDDTATDDPTTQDPATEDPMATVTAERDEYLDRWQRARADYDNLNKRRFKEVAEARDRGAAAVVDRLLEVLDNFGFALEAARASEDTQLSKGVQLVHGQLMDALRQAGLEEVPGAGSPFDPAHHEAVISEADGAERDGPEVAEVLRTGYRFKTQLLRPASVKVAE